MFVDPGRGGLKARIDEQNPEPGGRDKGRKELPPASRKGGGAVEKERDIHPEPGAYFRQPFPVEPRLEQPVARREHCRGIAASAAEPRGHGNVFPDLYRDARPASGGVDHRGRGLERDIAFTRRRRGAVAQNGDAFSVERNTDLVIQAHHLHQHFELMVTVGPPAEDGEAEVYLGGSEKRDSLHGAAASAAGSVKSSSSIGTFTSTSSYATVRVAFLSGFSRMTLMGRGYPEIVSTCSNVARKSRLSER